MNSTIELQKQLNTLLSDLIDQERVTANHVRIIGHPTDADTKHTSTIRYACLSLIDQAFEAGKQQTPGKIQTTTHARQNELFEY